MKKFWFCLAAVLAVSPTPLLAQGGGPQQSGQKIKVRVDLSLLNVVVVGKNGEFVTNLGPSNFRVYLCPPRKFNEKRKHPDATCEEVRLNPEDFARENMPPLALLVADDVSGSTRDYLDKFSKPATVELLKTLLLPGAPYAKSGDRYALWVFSESPLELADWNKNINLAAEKLLPFRSEGLTALLDTIYVAAKEKMRPLSNATSVMVVITDSLGNLKFPLVDPRTGDICPANQRIWMNPTGCRVAQNEDVTMALLQAHTVLYVIDFSRASNCAMLDRYFSEQQLQALSPFTQPACDSQKAVGEIAELSGGKRFFVDSVKDAEKAAREIAKRIGKMYVLKLYAKAPAKAYDPVVEIGATDENGEFKVDKHLTEHAFYQKRVYFEERH